MNSPQTKLAQRVTKSNTLVCVGLDSDFAKLPAAVQKEEFPQFAFNKAIIDATHEFVCAYKPNAAFYEARGEQGMHELKMTMEYLHQNHPDIFTICDAKRGDIGNTNAGYVQEIFDWFGFDAVTVSPYLGQEAVQPFLDRQDKVTIVLCRTSNPGAREFQDLQTDGEALWARVAKNVATQWNTNENCMVVVGATYPQEMAQVRKIVGDEMTFLVPGIGAQGGDLAATLHAGLNAQKQGLLINSGRGILFASAEKDFATAAAQAAKKLRDEINSYR